jgi:hypothetical protein
MSKVYNSPLSVGTGKGKFILNLNQYRNAHFRKTNNAKHKYKEFMREQIVASKKKLGKSLMIYTVYKGDKRSFDVGNICAIHQKFFEDAMVELGKLDDDKFSILPMCVFCNGGIDKESPRIEIEVIECGKGFKTKASKKIVDILGRLY